MWTIKLDMETEFPIFVYHRDRNSTYEVGGLLTSLKREAVVFVNKQHAEKYCVLCGPCFRVVELGE